MFGCSRYQLSVLAASLSLLNTSFPSVVVAFAPSSLQRQSSRASINVNDADTKKWWRSSSSATTARPISNDDDNNDGYKEFSTPEFNDADSLTRRRLVLSLLASASVVPLVAYATPDAATTTTTTQPILASAITPSPAEAATPIKILKPPLDKRTYDTFTLPNGLKVLLCSDPASTTSAVAMNVHVGACSDPVEIPGLAHFCEHMLFLGTEMYPEEDSFSKFLSSNGEHIIVLALYLYCIAHVQMLIYNLMLIFFISSNLITIRRYQQCIY